MLVGIIKTPTFDSKKNLTPKMLLLFITFEFFRINCCLTHHVIEIELKTVILAITLLAESPTAVTSLALFTMSVCTNPNNTVMGLIDSDFIQTSMCAPCQL